MPREGWRGLPRKALASSALALGPAASGYERLALPGRGRTACAALRGSVLRVRATGGSHPSVNRYCPWERSSTPRPPAPPPLPRPRRVPPPPVTCSRLGPAGDQPGSRPARGSRRRAGPAHPPATAPHPHPSHRDAAGGGERTPPHPGAGALNAHARPPRRCQAGRRGSRCRRHRRSSPGRCASALSGKGERP